jgi:hypothetical protein
MALSKTEMEQSLELFANCQTTLLEDFSEADHVTLEIWLRSVTLLNPAVMFRPDSVLEINERIFENQVISGFVLDLAFNFFAKAGGPEFTLDLCENLAHALALDGPEPNNCTIPSDVKLSMPQTLFGVELSITWISAILRFLRLNTELTLGEFLANNKHLVVVLLVHLTNTTSSTL